MPSRLSLGLASAAPAPYLFPMLLWYASGMGGSVREIKKKKRRLRRLENIHGLFEKRCYEGEKVEYSEHPLSKV